MTEWRYVPVEPTQEMCQAGQWKAKEWPKFPLRISPIYQAMLDAAPQSGQGTKAPTAWEVIDTANKRGAPVWLFDSSLIEADFNPTGTVDGHWQDDVGWMGAVWDGYRDEWTTKVVNPTHWMARTMPGSDCKAPTKVPTDREVAQDYPPLPMRLLYVGEPIWKGITEWADASGSEAYEAARRIDNAIISAMRAYLDAALATRSREVAVPIRPRFENVTCSQCGEEFGPGEQGFSHCDDHTGRTPK